MKQNSKGTSIFYILKYFCSSQKRYIDFSKKCYVRFKKCFVFVFFCFFLEVFKLLSMCTKLQVNK